MNPFYRLFTFSFVEDCHTSGWCLWIGGSNCFELANIITASGCHWVYLLGITSSAQTCDAAVFGRRHLDTAAEHTGRKSDQKGAESENHRQKVSQQLSLRPLKNLELNPESARNVFAFHLITLIHFIHLFTPDPRDICKCLIVAVPVDPLIL